MCSISYTQLIKADTELHLENECVGEDSLVDDYVNNTHAYDRMRSQE